MIRGKLLACGAITFIAASLGTWAGARAQDTAAAIDLVAIRARAATAAGEAEALAASARTRAQALASDAAASAEDASANGRRYADQLKRPPTAGNPSFDFDSMIAAAGEAAKQGLGEAPRFIAFASLSMPPASLRAMLDDVGRAGGVVVFRGLAQGSGKAMTSALSRILRVSEKPAGIGIDPRLFRAFGVSEVPTYVVAGSDFELCDGFDCTSEVPPFDRLSGNVTAEFALETIARGGGPGAKIAAQHLERLERPQP